MVRANRTSPAVGWQGLLAISLLVPAGIVVPPQSVQAQYEADEMDADAGGYNAVRAKRYARSPSGDAQERAAFGAFMKDYYLPMMTQYDAESLAELADNRADFLRSYLWNADPSVQEDLTKLAFSELPRVIKGRYHPAVRYNAMLIIGMLDAEYGSDRTGGSAPVVLSDANEYLTRYVDAGIDSPRAPPPLVVGALVGLERHAKVLGGLPEANRAATAAALLKVLQKDELPHEVSAPVEQWMKFIAARGLAGIGSLGPDNQVHTAMLDYISNESYRLNYRVRVAALMQSYANAYQEAAGLDQRRTVETLLQLASDIGGDEKERAREYEELALGGLGGGRGMGVGRGMGYGSGDMELPDVYKARRILLRLTGLKAGIEAVKPAIQDEQLAGLLTEVESAVDPVITSAEDEDVVALNLAADVKTMADAITATSANLGVEAVEAPPESEAEAMEEEFEEQAEEASPDA